MNYSHIFIQTAVFFREFCSSVKQLQQYSKKELEFNRLLLNCESLTIKIFMFWKKQSIEELKDS